MNVHPIPLNLHLPDDQLLDLFLFQWHTPDPLTGGTLNKIPPEHSQSKRAILEQFRDWVIGRDRAKGTTRPAFIIFPELSLPLSLTPIIESLLTDAERPMVVVAGIEYLTWSEYEALAEVMKNTRENETCPQDEQAGRFVNLAGIWVRDENARNADDLLRFLQSKLHPSDDERPRLHAGQNVLFFESSDRATEKRLNFCIQICSDFCNRDRVLAFRQEMEAKCPGRPLDFTFLPQHNPDQEADRFREAAEAYFRREGGKKETWQGCLVFVNNANERRGRTSQYGGSRLNFRYECWRRLLVPLKTCRIKGYPTHQAVIVRESGPGIYWLLYKPECGVDRRPGGEQSEPFLDSGFLPIENDHLGSDCCPLWPEAHWLGNEWGAGAAVFASDIQANSQQHAGMDRVVGACEGAYRQSSLDWCDYLAVHPEMARFALNVYFDFWEKEPDFPGQEPEPQSWSADVATGARRFMESYCLLKLGEAGAPGGVLVPHCERPSWHGRFGNEVRILFLWGNGSRNAKAMIAECRNLALEVALLTSKVLFVLVDPRGGADSHSLREDLKAERGDIATGQNLRGLLAHLHADGEVVNPRYARHFNMICNHTLLDGACAATGGTNLRSRLADTLRAELQ